MKTKYKPEVGVKYGTWTIISEEVKQGNKIPGLTDRNAYWKVICDCGRESWKNAKYLLKGSGNESCKSCARTQTYKNAFSISYLNRVKNRAMRSNFEFDIDAEYVWQLYENQNKKCALSGLDIYFKYKWHGDIDQTASLDRIDNTQGYVKGNVQWLHKDVNNMKHVHDQNYFLSLCRKISEYSND